MNKVLTVILPYCIVVINTCLILFQVNDVMMLEGFVVGLLSSIWFIIVHKTQGTKDMKYITLFNIVLFLFVMIFALMNQHMTWISQAIPVLIYTLVIECFGFYILCKNKPTLSMTYHYSYKNSRRRFF